MAKKAEKLASDARARAEKWRAAWQKNIDQYHRMTEFVYGQQWDEDEKAMLKEYNKIPMQVNKLSTLAVNVIGEQQQNTPQLNVIPTDGATEQVAEIRELVVKDIVFKNSSKNVYQVAASQAFVGGFSAFAWIPEYENLKSFNQELVPLHFKDPTVCYWDLSAEKIGKTDGMGCGWLTRMSRLKLREVFGKNIEKQILPDDKNSGIAATTEEVAQATQAGTSAGSSYIWADEDAVTIQHDFVKKVVKETLYKLSNNRTVNQDELDEIIDRSFKLAAERDQVQYQQEEMQQAEGMPQEGMAPGVEAMPQAQPTQNPDLVSLYDGDEAVRIIDRKEGTKTTIKHYKFCGDYLLDENEFPSDQLPLVFVDQASYYDKNSNQICRPFLIDAVDTQKYLNYLATQSAYVLKVSRYDQWIGSKKNIQSQQTQKDWTDPVTIKGMLTYDESPSGIVPQKISPPELSQSLITQYQRAMEDLYTSTGLYPTRLGQQGNEVSGEAIDARTRQGSYSTYQFFNSINRAIATGGEIVNEMIPNIYDTERTMSLMTPDGRQDIKINEESNEYGEGVKNDIRKGTFQVKLIPGPSFEGQKEQAIQSLNSVIHASPETFPLIADLYADNLPLANNIEIKNRLKTMVPPEILEAGKTGKPLPQHASKPDPMQQMAQAQIQLKMKDLQLKEQELQMKAEKLQHEMQMEMERLQSEKLQIAGQLEKQQLEYMSETGRTQSDAAIAHADNMTKILTHKVD